MTLYVYDGTPEQTLAAECIGAKSAAGCSATFQPAMAPDAAVARIGDFSVVVRKNDHVRQWAYRGLPLYTFSGDSKPGDTLGVYGGNTDGWQVMMLSIDAFPQNVQAIKAVGRGTVLADAASMPLYVVARYDDRWGGFNAYTGYSNAYRMGKMLGISACNTECLQMRHPVLALPTDQSKGYWEVFDRGDGMRQWAYKGFALYSYAGDKQPGVVTGGNVLQLLLGDNSGQMGLGADEFGATGPSSIASSAELAKGYSTASLQVVKGYSLSTLKDGEVGADQSKLAAFYWYAARP
jgi:predicted lipoprotein with Yx(FWY)xxD motif